MVDTRVLVTGVAGFVGSALARRLCGLDIDVVGLDSITPYYDPRIKRRNLASIQSSHFDYIEGDLNLMNLEPVLRDCSVIFHEAGQPGVRSSWGEQFRGYVEDNVLATQRLLEFAKDAPCLTRLVYASSSSIYGDPTTFPTRESSLPRPLSPYGVSKLAAEHLCSLYAANFGVPCVSLRYFTVYGPGQRPDMAFTRFCWSAVKDRSISLYGDGTQIRDFTFVEDVVDANIATMTLDLLPGTVMNIAGGSNISVNEVLDILEGLIGHSLNVVRQAVVAGDVIRTSASVELAWDLLHWSPTTRIRDGLAKQLDWVREVSSEDRDPKGRRLAGGAGLFVA